MKIIGNEGNFYCQKLIENVNIGNHLLRLGRIIQYNCLNMLRRF